MIESTDRDSEFLSRTRVRIRNHGSQLRLEWADRYTPVKLMR